MKKSISFNGIAHIKMDGNVIVDEGGQNLEIEMPNSSGDLTFLEGKLVIVTIKIHPVEG